MRRLGPFALLLLVGCSSSETAPEAADAATATDATATDSTATDSTAIDSTAIDSTSADAAGDATATDVAPDGVIATDTATAMETGLTDTSAAESAVDGTPGDAPSDADAVVDTFDAPPATTRWYVVRQMHLGGTTRAGVADTNAWKSYGVDLDARVTTADSMNTCVKAPQASGANPFSDGNDGIDNQFGSKLRPMLEILPSGGGEASANQKISEGKGTWMLSIEWNGFDGPAPGALFLTGENAAPSFASDARWPMDPSSLSGSTPKIQFAQGTVSGGIWTSGPLYRAKVDVPWPWIFGGYVVSLPMESLVIKLKLSDGSLGVLAGAALASDVKTAFGPLLAASSACGGGLAQSFYDSIQGTVNLVAGAPELQVLSQTCDSISFGIAFTAASVGAPSGTSAARTPPTTCP